MIQPFSKEIFDDIIPISISKSDFYEQREVIISSVLYSVRIKETIFVFLTTDDSMFSQAPEALLRLAP